MKTGVTGLSLSVTFRWRGLSWSWTEGDVHLWHLSVWGRVRRGRGGCLVSSDTWNCCSAAVSGLTFPQVLPSNTLVPLNTEHLDKNFSLNCTPPLRNTHWGLVHGWPFHLTSITRAGRREKGDFRLFWKSNYYPYRTWQCQAKNGFDSHTGN